MTSPRRLRMKRKHPSCKPLFWALVFGVTAFCTITSMSQLLVGQEDDETNNERRLQEPPDSFVDLWPNDRNEGYRKALQSSTVLNTNDLQLEKLSSNNSNKRRVALVRPIGRLGDVFVEFVTRVVQKYHNKQDADSSIELVPVLPLSSDVMDDFSLAIRLTTLPVVLQAADIALTLSHNHSPPLLLLDDLMDLMRYEMRWQCHLQTTLHLPLLTITLDRLMGFPTKTIRQVLQFLNLDDDDEEETPPAKDSSKHNSNNKHLRIDMDDLALIVMDRVNGGSALVQQLISTTTAQSDNTQEDPDQAVVLQLDQVVEEEIQRFSSTSDGNACLPLPTYTNDVLEKELKKTTSGHQKNAR
ncbi:expressed unknown protein [Seminavis robusta]|uniref:Uncharacterized protein n=1 Tax=Seminavis robusta TaxID=568900 RepID=A0A9N8EGA9_9STRA|nr:expressed unknown protein [Seminavis robusta]|eukprot:Sro958_g224610.1 n/a (356) ;mRNA; r:14263-15330